MNEALHQQMLADGTRDAIRSVALGNSFRNFPTDQVNAHLQAIGQPPIAPGCGGCVKSRVLEFWAIIEKWEAENVRA